MPHPALAAFVMLVSAGAVPAHPPLTRADVMFQMQPTPDEYATFYPAAARLNGIGGDAEILCRIDGEERLQACVLKAETPPSQGFGASALRLASAFLVTPKTLDGSPTAGRFIDLHVPFQPASGPNYGATPSLAAIAAPPRSATNPAPEYYPPNAKNLKVEGRTTISCTVGDDLKLKDCTVVKEEPPGFGFGEASLRLSSMFRIRPTTPNGKSAVGGKFTKTIIWKMPNPPPHQ